MRKTSIGIVTTLAALAFAQSGNTQESFFNSRYCTQGGRGGSGVMDCSYHTWAQCQASARGLGRYCTENPNWRARGTVEGRSRFRRD
jgi:Protein of unknown function (DUF3551)